MPEYKTEDVLTYEKMLDFFQWCVDESSKPIQTAWAHERYRALILPDSATDAKGTSVHPPSKRPRCSGKNVTG